MHKCMRPYIYFFSVCACLSFTLFHFCPLFHCLLSSPPCHTFSTFEWRQYDTALGKVYSKRSDLSFPGLPLNKLSDLSQVVCLLVFSSRNAVYIRWFLGFIPALNSVLLWVGGVFLGFVWPLTDFEWVINSIPLSPSRTVINQTILGKWFVLFLAVWASQLSSSQNDSCLPLVKEKGEEASRMEVTVFSKSNLKSDIPLRSPYSVH